MMLPSNTQQSNSLLSLSPLSAEEQETKNGGLVILQKFLKEHPLINFIRVCYVDYLNSVKYPAIIPKSMALKNVSQAKYIFSFVSPCLPAYYHSGEVNKSVLEPGIDELHFDWTSLRECKYSPGHAVVMAFIRIPQPGKAYNGYGLDPRWLLHHQLDLAKPLKFLVGHEIEFFLYSDATADFESPPPQGSWASSTNLIGYTHILDEIVLGLEAVGIEVNKYHAEGVPLGSFEVVLAPLEPISAADALVYSREMIYHTAKKHGMSATFSPGPFEKGLEIGGHINLSIHPSEEHEHFLAGTIEHLPAACAFLMPTYEAGSRQHRFGAWASWGVENKFVPIRQRGQGFYENRCVDGTVNPYLATGILIAAGMHGIRNRTPLVTKPSNQISQAPTGDLVQTLGLTKKMPASLQEALDELENDKPLIELFSKDLVKMYLLLKRYEIQCFQAMSSRERRAALRARY